jgi:hypothetical protein
MMYPPAFLQDRREDRRHAEQLCGLRQGDDVVYDKLRLVTVQVGKLKCLMIHQEKDALFGGEKPVETGIGYFGSCHGVIPYKRRSRAVR